VNLLLRCLIVLLSLALANGNAHAALHLHTAHGQPCPEEHVHHGGKSSPHHQHRHDKGIACCCDCLGCSSGIDEAQHDPMKDRALIKALLAQGSVHSQRRAWNLNNDPLCGRFGTEQCRHPNHPLGPDHTNLAHHPI